MRATYSQRKGVGRELLDRWTGYIKAMGPAFTHPATLLATVAQRSDR